MRKIWIVLFFLFAFSVANAEVNGTINASNFSSAAPVTGLFGYTVKYCDLDSQCFGYKCFRDFDDEIEDADTSQPSGNCSASKSQCVHDGRWYNAGTHVKNTNVTYYTCLTNLTGNWSGIQNCAADQTFSYDSTEAGNCTASSATTSSTTTGGGGTTTKTEIRVGIDIVGFPSKLGVVQGGSATVNITVKNTGNRTLTDIMLSLPDIDQTWFSISPASVASLYALINKTFSVTFSVPASAEVRSHNVTLTVTTSNASAKDSEIIVLNVLPGEEASAAINKTYADEFSMLLGLEKDLSSLEKANEEDVNAIKNIIQEARSKLLQANESIANNDYFTAKQLLSGANTLMADAAARIPNVRYVTEQPPALSLPSSIDPIWLIAAGILMLVIVILAFLFWPKGAKQPTLFR